MNHPAKIEDPLSVNIVLPASLSTQIVTQLIERANEIAANGNRWLNLKTAAQIASVTRADLRRAVKLKQIAHNIDKRGPVIKESDLWAWRNQTRVEAKQIL